MSIPLSSEVSESTEELTKDGILDILNEGDEVEEEKPKELEEEEVIKDKKEEKEEGKEEEEEIKIVDEDEKKEEEEKFIVPAKMKEMKTKHPKVFEEFPYLEVAYYKAKQYSDIYPTVGDAREAFEKANALDGFEADLMDGNMEAVLNGIKNTDEEAFNKIVDNYLPVLAKVDQQRWMHVVGSMMSTTVQNMLNYAKENNNEDMAEAARILNQFIFNKKEPVTLGKLSKNTGDNEESKKLQKEREDFAREKFESVRDELNGKVQNSLKLTIDQNIDPKGLMTEYVKKSAIREALEMTNNLLLQDKDFRRQLDGLWRNSFKKNFAKESNEAVRIAFMAKAKSILPDVIKKIRQDALKGGGKVEKKEQDRKGPTPIRGSASSQPKQAEFKKGMRTIDFLNED